MRELRSFKKHRCGPNEALRKNKISQEEFERWRSLLHALKAYEEGEAIEITVEENLTIRQLRRVLTQRRLELLEQIRLGVSSITELAKKTGPRDIKNVHDDLQILKKLGFIELERDGKKVTPRLLLSRIRLEFR